MAFSDILKQFVEDRLLSYDPSIDLSAGSPVQLKVIDPLITKFAIDPLETDIAVFIRERLLQEFPDMAVDNGGQLEDLFVNPLKLLLDPIKREILSIKKNQSISNVSIMADEELDNLAANFFKTRSEGSTASGLVRLFFNAPITSRVGPENRLYTSSGLFFTPVTSFYISAAQMLFNRVGSLYYMDILVEAEKAGTEYNVEADAIFAIESLQGIVKVSNPSKFINGRPRQDNETFAASIPDALSNRSVAVPRGLTTTVLDSFSSIQAVQVVGAGDEGMDRDILKGTSEGKLFLCASGIAYGDWILLDRVLFKDDGDDDNLTIEEGDTIKFHAFSNTSIPYVTGAVTMFESTIKSIYSTGTSDAKYLLLLEDSIVAATTTGRIAILKPGKLTISEVPGGIAKSLIVEDGAVHLGGHTDVFVRPSGDTTTQAVVKGVADKKPVLAITDLFVPTELVNAVATNSNIVESVDTNFVEEGVTTDHILIIETNNKDYFGSYKILEVGDPADSNNPKRLRVDKIFTNNTATQMRARIVDDITIDLINPKIGKVPFDPVDTVSDLRTNVGSKTFILSDIDSQAFGVVVGDKIEILSGEDAGVFTIESFDPTLGGYGPIVDREATASGGNLKYRIYTELNGLTAPFVRVKDIEVLDSLSQGTGTKIPYADTICVKPICDFEGAVETETIYDRDLVFLPDAIGYFNQGGFTNDPAVSPFDNKDARYTQKTESYSSTDKIRKVAAHGSNPITTIEVLMRDFLWSGKRDKLLAFPTKLDTNYKLDPTGIHKTSELAESEIGDSLTILEGINAGNYVIIDKQVYEVWTATATERGRRKVVVVQVDPELPSDPYRTIINLINEEGTTTVTYTDLFRIFQKVTDWPHNDGFWKKISGYLHTALTNKGFTFTGGLSDIETLVDTLTRSSYVIGKSAKGTARSYFLNPTSVELSFGDSPTVFTSTDNKNKKFRLDPNLPPTQIFPESSVPTGPTQWSRDVETDAPNSRYVYSNSGTSLVNYGIKVGDTVEFHRAINDLYAKKDMSSSWLGITRGGSNIVQLILPRNPTVSTSGLSNYKVPEAGQLLFIDSGPDTNGYTINSVEELNWDATNAIIKVRVDKPLTASSDNYPEVDFATYARATILSTGTTFPLTFSSPQTFEISTSTDFGATYGVQGTATLSGTYANIDALLVDLASLDDAAIRTGKVGNNFYIQQVTSGSPLFGIKVTDEPGAVTAGTFGMALNTERLAFLGCSPEKNTLKVYSSGFTPTIAPVNKYITLYAARSATSTPLSEDASYLGTFKIVSRGIAVINHQRRDEYYIELDRASNFPNVDNIGIRWVIHSAPKVIPAETSGGGRQISSQFVRVRLYDETKLTLTVSNIPWTEFNPIDPNSRKQLYLSDVFLPSTSKNYNFKCPYRIVRDGIFRVSSTTMSNNREGALYYVDVPLVSYGSYNSLNITENETLKLDSNYKIDGYKLNVLNESFTFSEDEEVELVLSASILPRGLENRDSNKLVLYNYNLNITYDQAPEVSDVQRLLESPQDRAMACSVLVRHFLPSYVTVEAGYSGGSLPSVVAKDLIEAISKLSAESSLTVDRIIDLIKKRGASSINYPINLFVLTHGIDRKLVGTFSTSFIGGVNVPDFKGTFAQTYFIAGANSSTDEVRPELEQIYLIRS